MKIFTWMHRKLHTNVDYSMISREKDTFYEDGKKSFASVTCDKDTAALLPDRDHVTVVDPFGLLAIGTFGVDPLNAFRFEDGYSVHEVEYSVEEDGEEEEDEEEEEEEEEEGTEVTTPLGVTAFKREVERDVGSEVLKSQPLMGVEAEDLTRPFLKDDEEKKKKGERTTLADLFYADAVKIGVAEKCNVPKISADTGRKTGCSKKQVRSLAKKLMPWKAEDSRPTTKLHRLMRKMLKRKIHPEIERKIDGAIDANDASEVEAPLDVPGLKNNLSIEAGGNESASLLQGIKESCR